MEPDSNLKPVQEFHIYKRNLQHWEDPGNLHFITFKTAEGFILPEAAKDITLSSIKFHANRKYILYACVVMDTHVHSILQPLEESRENYYSLAQIMHSIKSYSANNIQRLLNRQGKVWQSENYDRIVRDEHEYMQELNYIIYNPLKAGLVDKPEYYNWLFVKDSE